MNTQYKNNLKAVMNVCKKYADDKIEQALELLEDYNLSSDTVSQLSQTATAPSDVRTSSLIEVGGNCVKLAPSTASDNTVAKDKVIPENTFKLTIDKIGGMSYKRVNECISILSDTTWDFWFRFYAKPNTTYYAKVFNNNVSSPSDAKIGLTADNNKYSYVETYYDESYSHSLTTGFSFTTGNITEGYYKLRFQFNAQKSFTGDGMIVVGSTAPTEFKPYFEGIRDSAVTSVVIKGFNVWDEQWELGSISTTNGTNVISDTQIRAKNQFRITPNTTYYFKGTSTYFNAFYYDINGNFISYSAQTINNTFTTPNNAYYMRFNLLNAYGTTYLNDICINLSNSANGTYKPYVQPITKQIPAEVQALDGYGQGTSNSVDNYIDFDNKFIQGCKKIVLNGSETWYRNGGWSTEDNISMYMALNPRPVNASLDCLLDKDFTIFGNVAVNSTTIDQFRTASDSIYLNFTRGGGKLTEFTLEKAKEWLANNPLTIIIPLATPIETDISTYLTDFNPVELNNNYASIEFVNQYNQDVPNTISFSGIIKETLVNSFTINGVTTNITDTIESDGWSASNTVFNTRKTRDRQRIKRVGKIDLGTLTWSKYSNNNSFYAQIEDKKVGIVNALCSKYDCSNSSHTVTTIVNEPNTIGQNPTNNYIYFYSDDTANMTTEQFKTAMSGVFLYYELETPVITELNVTPDFHYLALASGETITFNNTNNQPCHNTIRYSIMEEKV